MLRRRLAALLLTGGLALLGAPLAATAPAAATGHTLTAHRDAVTTVYYDASQAGDFADTVTQAAEIWNESVQNVRMEPGSPANITITEIYGGGSYTVPRGLGSGAVYIDYYQAQQYNPVRIMAHEFGHIYGLPDNYNGDCSILMSGHSAGYDCQTTHPSAAEAAQVDRNFAGGAWAEPAVAAYRGCFDGPTHRA